MLTYLLIFFVMALAFAPLLHFLPGKRQRHMTRLREFAAVNGLFVEFRTLPKSEWVRRPADISAGDIIYYGKRLPSVRGGSLKSASWLKGPNGWRAVGERAPTPVPLLDLGDLIIAASVDQGSCGVYWVESTQEEGVQKIQAALEVWSAQLLARDGNFP